VKRLSLIVWASILFFSDSIALTSLAQQTQTPPSSPAKPEPNVLIAEVVVKGAEGKLEEAVYKAIRTKAGGISTRSQLQKDINAIFATGFFANVKAVPEDTSLGVRVTFIVEPNPVLRKVVVTTVPQGNSLLSPNLVNDIFSKRYGSILNFQTFQQDLKKLTQWYQDKGYTLAQVLENPKVAKDGTVTLQLTEGLIEDIQVRFLTQDGKDKYQPGTAVTFDTPIPLILERLESKPNQIFNRNLLTKDLKRLYDTEIFADVKATFKSGKNPNKVIVVLNVTENELAAEGEGILTYQAELRTAKAKKDEIGEANALNKIGNVYFKLADEFKTLEHYLEQAIPKYQKALQIYQAKKDTFGQAKIFNNLGNVYNKLNNYQQAVNAYEQALTRFKQIKVPWYEAITLSNLASNYQKLDNKDRALSSYKQALNLWYEIEKDPSTVNLLSNINSFKKDEPEVQKAGRLSMSFSVTKSEGTVYHIWLQIGDNSNKIGISEPRFWQAFILLNISALYQSTGDYQQALYSIDRGQQISQNVSYNQLFSVDTNSVDKEKKGLYTNDIITILREAMPSLAIAQLYLDLGEKNQALKYANKFASQLRVTLGKLRSVLEKEGSDVSPLIQTYLFLEKIIDNFEDDFVDPDPTNEVGVPATSLTFDAILSAFPKSQQTQFKPFISFIQASSQIDLAKNYTELGKHQQALDLYNKVLALLSESQAGEQSLQISPLWKASLVSQQLEALRYKGDALLALGKNQEAMETYKVALSLAKSANRSTEEAETIYAIANVHSANREYPQALEYYKRSRSLWQTLKNPLKEADTHLGMAIVERNRGNLDLAKTEIETAIEDIESERAQIIYQEQKEKEKDSNSSATSSNSSTYKSYIDLATYLESKQNYYDFYIDLLMQQHRQNPTGKYNVLAFQASERSRARSLRAIFNRANRSNQTDRRAVELAQPRSLAEIQQQILDDNTLLLEYALGEERSYLWAVTKTSITSYELPKRAEIEATARQFYRLLTDKRAPKFFRADLEKTSDRLSQMLLSPVAAQLRQKRLVIVGDGALQYIPFAALPKPATDKPLLVEHEIVGLPSASTLIAVRVNRAKIQPANKTIAVLADPVFGRQDERAKQIKINGQFSKIEDIYGRLPNTRQEASQISLLVPPDRRSLNLDFGANRQRAIAPEIGQYRFVHLATHGILDSKRPERSGMIFSVLSDRGELQRSLLSTSDVFNLKLSADLVVLSGCQTALGKSIKGEGLIGLTGGLMYSGAKQVVSSLWSVDDPKTALFMTDFYQGMLQKNLPPATALRQTQLKMWKQQQAPYYWAAFVIQGEE
jgi:CHAT domain-containing protein/predicted negative regulator of RcsB-dependent stress response